MKPFCLLLGILATSPLLPAQTGKVYVEFKVTSNWNTAFSGQISITNHASWIIWDWKLEFDFRHTITSLWNADYRKLPNGRWVIEPGRKAWVQKNIKPGQKLTFGFSAKPGGTIHTPTKGTLCGYPIVFNGYSNAPPPLKPQVAPVWPKRVFAPYVDVTQYPPFDLEKAARTVGIQFFTLAFVVSKSNSKPVPSWGGYYPTDKGFLLKPINALRAWGSDVIVSFGGQAGTELAVAASNVQELVKAYQSVIDSYKLTHIDFDIEGAWVAHPRSIRLRSQALAILQKNAAKAGRKLKIWLTLPVMPYGLTQDGLNVVKSAVAAGVNLAGVNIMAMDYGGPSTHMGKDAIDAAVSTHKQLMGILKNKTADQVWAMIGVTPMIGKNDVHGEFFYQKDMRMVLSFALQKKIGMLSFWSLTRDFPPPAGQVGQLSPHHSGIPQKPFEFSRIALPFTPPWRNLGFSLAGSKGIPALEGTGALETGKPFSLDLARGPAQAASVLVVGATRKDLPFLGGVLVPAPTVFLPGVTDPSGSLQWKAVWPGNTPYGTALYYQAWCLDKGAARGVSASNALESRNR